VERSGGNEREKERVRERERERERNEKNGDDEVFFLRAFASLFFFFVFL